MTTAAPPAMDPQGLATTTEAIDGSRHAALLLHAMGAPDRDWVLDALDAAQRESLRRLLGELEELGIASDPSLVAQAIEAAASTPEPAEPGLPMSDEDGLRALDGPQLQAMFHLLRREPAGLVAAWLRIADWPWRQQLLAALDPRDRQRAEALMAAAPASPAPEALRTALVAAVASHLRETPASEPAPARGWARFGTPWRGRRPGGSVR